MKHKDLIDELVDILGPKGVLTAPDDVAPYVTDFRHRRTGSALAVLLPANTEEVSRAVAAVTSRGIAVYPQGGNTGLCYGAVPDKGVVICLRRMRKLRNADPLSGLLTVDAGLTLAEVHQEAEKLNMQFPLYLGSDGTAQIGGLVSTNAGGTGVLRYGSMRDLTAGVEVVLADGSILNEMQGLRKNNTGYNITQLVAGAEGTLGIVTGAVLRLAPRMTSRAVAWLGFEDIDAALKVGSKVRTTFGADVEALELVDDGEINCVLRNMSEVRMPLSEVPAYSLIIEIATPRVTDNLNDLLEEVLVPPMEEGLISDAVIAQNETQAAEIWHFRHSVTEANQLNGVGVVLDTSVRPSAVEEFVRQADIVTAEMFPKASRQIVAHLADGNVHYIVMFPRDIWDTYPDKPAKELEVEEAIHNVAQAVGGTFSAEHGIGRKLTDEMTRLIDPIRLDVMKRIKTALDPDNLMNPSILIP
ncbi:FAD/FMN-containing dehydrogenase [Cohaesibacter sp. ES.047]|uniref:FAD-binding oxidoreductase n=1 Tax=Cohaesibacter sp. ES.047 TaxID=1798205 RepID=UPI000BB84E8E|nr:FAD-binding oxidoreductase [Cohaesibacter sp. ES.047]SNY93605.1 FAD/FMN-containing dehydrogenase [Cohaesibacter sp. ES.047]